MIHDPWRRACVAACLLLLGGSVPADTRAAAVDAFCEATRRPVAIDGALAPFVEVGARPVCAAAADLNLDGLQDWLLVTERVRPWASGQEEERKRALLIVVRDRTGGLRLARRNDRAVHTSTYGGVMDPFVGVSVGTGSFQLQHYGGSAWRWEWEHTFRYVPSRDKWELTEVLERRFNVIFGPGSTTESRSQAPRGLDIADFDAETLKSRL